MSTAPLLFSQVPDVASERTELEVAVVNQLASLRRQAGGPLELVGPYAGELGGLGEDDVKERMKGRLPAVLVATGTEEVAMVGLARAQVSLELELIVISGHLRSKETRSQGDEKRLTDPTADPGIYDVLAACRHLLHARDLGLARFGQLLLRRSTPSVRLPLFFAYQMVFEVQYRFEVAPLGTTVGRPIQVVEHHHHPPGEPDVVVGEVSREESDG